MRNDTPYQLVFSGGFAHLTPVEEDEWFGTLNAPPLFFITDLFFCILSFLPFRDMRSLTQTNRKLLGLRSKTTDHPIGEEILKRMTPLNIIPHWPQLEYRECLEYIMCPNQEHYFQELENQFNSLQRAKYEISEDGEKIIFSALNRKIIFSANNGQLVGITEKKEEDMLLYLTSASSDVFSPLLYRNSSQSMSYSSQCEDYLTIRDDAIQKTIHQSRIMNVCAFILCNGFIFLIEYERISQIKLRLQKYTIPTSMNSSITFFSQKEESVETVREAHPSRKRHREEHVDEPSETPPSQRQRPKNKTRYCRRF
jgi:hypothetical protein